MREIRRVVACEGWELTEVILRFCILTGVVVTRVYTSSKLQTVHLRSVHFTANKFYQKGERDERNIHVYSYLQLVKYPKVLP